MKIAVIGLGKIGLPLAVQYALKGNTVVGVDINSITVDCVNRGKEPFPEEKDLNTLLYRVVTEGNLVATTEYSEGIQEAEVIVVAVPVIVNKVHQPDFSIIEEVSQRIGSHMTSGTLICYETTLPVGTTRNRLTPILERFSSLDAKKDFHVVFSPERVLTGRVFADLRRYPKIVGGLSPKCAEKGREFYSQVLDFDYRSDLSRPNGVWVVADCETAEFVKLAETTYRDVNIGLANQFAIYADKVGVDIFDVIESANSQPFSLIHQPGIAVGGHCIPVYPYFYLQGDPGADLVKCARTINETMPNYVVSLLEKNFGKLEMSTILVLGVSYRPNVKESAFSGAFTLNELISAKGAVPVFLDPLFTDNELESLGLRSFDGNYDSVDAIILHTAHSNFENFIDRKFSKCKIVVDGRNFLQAQNVPFPLLTLGSSQSR